MSERSMAAGEAVASDDGQARTRPSSAVPSSPAGLTRAEAHALSRCAPLTPAEFKARRRVAEQGFVSLRGLLKRPGDTRAQLDVRES